MFGNDLRPAQAAQSLDPTQCSGAAQSSGTAQSSGAAQSSNPAQSSGPAQSSHPAQSAHPTQSSDPTQSSNPVPEAFLELVNFVKEKKLVNELPSRVRQGLVAAKVLSQSDAHDEIVHHMFQIQSQPSLYKEPELDFSRSPSSLSALQYYHDVAGRNAIRRGGPRPRQTRRTRHPAIRDEPIEVVRKLREQYQLISTCIVRFVDEWQDDSIAMELALRLIVWFCDIATNHTHKRDWECAHCRYWKYDYERCEEMLDRCLVRIVSRHCYTILQKVNEELAKPSPRWNPEWFAFVEQIFMRPQSSSTGLHGLHGRPRYSTSPYQKLYEWSTDDYPNNLSGLQNFKAFAFISHIYANIQVFWGLEVMLPGKGLPLEIRTMVFNEVLKKKGIRKLPAANHNLECPDCTAGCKTRDEPLYWDLERNQWSFQLKHWPVLWDPSTKPNHEPGCSCRRDRMTVEEAEKFSQASVFDPGHMLEQLQDEAKRKKKSDDDTGAGWARVGGRLSRET